MENEIPPEDNSPEAVASALGFAGAGIMAGQRAKTADKAKLAQAIELEKEGVPSQNIFQATGWYRGTDGEWKFEISDLPARLEQVTRPVKGFDAAGNIVANRTLPATTGPLPLETVLDHPQLYEAYPDLRNLPYKQADLASGLMGFASPTEGVAINSRLQSKEALSTLLHELQHQIQGNEGFAIGGNPDSANQMFPEASPADDPNQAYRRLSGEVESRNVQARLAAALEGDFSPLERAGADAWTSVGTGTLPDNAAGIVPTLTEDTPAARQLRVWLTQKSGFPQMEFLQLLSKVLK
jgi:hypothetical protein